MSTLQSVFVSHGAPTIVMEETPASAFLKTLGNVLPRPQAILVASAHWETAAPALGLTRETIHDFYGFPRALYEIDYKAPVARDVAIRAQALLKDAGFDATLDETRGRDHGVWTPLMLGYPAADIPIVPLSLQPHLGPAHHFRMGQALKPLRDEGVLILGSGGATHNLRALMRAGGDAPTPAWASGFADWLDTTLTGRDDAALIDWQRTAPQADLNHPSHEHFLPIHVARGAAAGEASVALHKSWAFGALSMNAYAFGGG